MTCDPWDVVTVPFPFSDRPGEKRRPAVVLSRRKFNREGHTALLMITTKIEPPWPGDRQIVDRVAAGLPVLHRPPQALHARQQVDSEEARKIRREGSS